MPEYKYAKWLGETQYAGPKLNKRVLIVKGEVRKIKHKSSDGYYILHGLDENGNFGWVEPNDIQLMETRKWVEEN